MINVCDIYETIFSEVYKRVMALWKNLTEYLKITLNHKSAIEFLKI